MFLIAILALAHAPPGYICNYARIRPVSQHGGVAVYATPSTGAGRIKTLKAGNDVYICDEAKEWIEVRFRAAGHPCPGTRNGLSVRRAASCMKGWVRKSQVNVMSG